jgi:hypothetical protein
MIKKYRKKPVVVEAIQYLGEENIFQVQEWFKKNKSSRDLIYKPETNEYYIKTLEGEYILTELLLWRLHQRH